MKTSLLTVALALVVTPCVIGCAEQEVEAGQPAFPQAVGYTPPANLPPPPPPPSAGQVPQDGQPGAQDPQQAAQPEDVVIGGQDGDQYADTDPSALTDFRSTLDPYGSWTEDPTYGTVWVPSQSVVGEDFTPYVSAGHWVYDNDYAWVSDYDWGWAPFHYGRWVYGSSAWEWIPGRAYAGAWTSWRYGYGDWGYVGWAPLPPTWGWRGGRAVGLGFVPSAPYAFVGTQHLFSPNVGTRLVAGGQVGVIASHTQPWVPASAGVGGMGAHSVAHPTVGGPPPSALNLQSSAVARASVTDHGLSQARAFSRASTATSLGARAPAQATARTAQAGWGGGARVPSYAASPSHFGGRFGAGFSGSASSAAPSRGYAGSSRPYYGSSPSYGGSRYSAPARSSSGYGGNSGYSGYRGGGYSTGGYHGGGGTSGGFHGGGGGFSGGGGGGGFHGGGGGGGFHGGGGGGGFHGGGGGGHGGGHR